MHAILVASDSSLSGNEYKASWLNEWRGILHSGCCGVNGSEEIEKATVFDKRPSMSAEKLPLVE